MSRFQKSAARRPHERRVTPDRRGSSHEQSLVHRIANHRGGAMTAQQLSEILSVSAISLYKLAKSGCLPSFRIGTSVRFCPATVARWLRERGG